MPHPPSTEFLQLQQALAGRFSLEREVGRGGMGIVFLARDVALDRPVAIKLLPHTLAAQPEFRERFLKEARTSAKLSHPNVVPIHLVEERGDLVYFVMTFVDGETLGQRVRRAGPLTSSQATRMVQEVAWALAYAHGRGIIHRDIKPDNILLDKDTGRAMVSDFGIARVAGTGTTAATGEIVGTAHYMSPEQATGDTIDGRSDIFSLGITAFFALTGQLPFEGPHLPAVVTRIVNAPAPRIADVRPGVPGALAEAIDRCLAKSPDARFASGEELAEAVGTAVAAPEAAPQVRFLLKSFQGLELAAVVLWAGLMFGPKVAAALWASDPFSVVLWGTTFGAFIAWSVWQVIHATRQAIRAGLGPVDVRRAIEREGRQRREEVQSVLGGKDVTAEQIEHRRRNCLLIGHAGVIGTIGIIAIPRMLDSPVGMSSPILRGAFAVSVAIALVGYGVAQAAKGLLTKPREARQPSMVGPLSRLLGTRFVTALFRFAGRGLDVPAQNAPPASERTEVLLASAAGDLFNRLPLALQDRFADVPRVVRRLEGEADRLSKLELAARRTNAGAETTPARANARERFAITVAALENIRLDLMRLDAGLGTPDDLTSDLEKARAISEAVDAEVLGRDEVAKLLAAPRTS